MQKRHIAVAFSAFAVFAMLVWCRCRRKVRKATVSNFLDPEEGEVPKKRD